MPLPPIYYRVMQISAGLSGKFDETSLLLEEILKSGTHLRIRVTGKSMVPFLNSGETVTLRGVPPSGLRRGDLIFFRNAYGAPVLHRIVRKRRGRDGKLMFQTMGDAVARYDSPVSGEEILGRVCRIEKNGTGKRTTDMDSFFQRRMNSLIAAILFIRSEAYGTFSLVMGMARAVL